MIKESDAFLEKILELIVQERHKCSPMAMARALVRAANACLQLVEPQKQKAALQLAKSELEYQLEEAGGLVETLKDVISDQSIKITLMEMALAEFRKGDSDDNRLQ